MSYYPENGKFLTEFARRTLQNLEAIQSGERVKWDDTALMSFLLAVFVVPQDRSGSDFMAELLTSYPEDFLNVFEIIRMKKEENETGIPHSLKLLPGYLRNAVAHFNVRPESVDGNSLTHLLVWNRIPETARKNAGKITFVARVDVAKLRGLAIHILRQMQDRHVSDRYEFIDPIRHYDADWSEQG